VSRTDHNEPTFPLIVQLLDITTLSLGILTIVGGLLYFFVLDQYVQNLAVVFLCAVLTAVTFGTRLKISGTTQEDFIRNHLIEWVVASAFLIVFALILMFLYPMGRNFWN
jgi:hypothetical protein